MTTTPSELPSHASPHLGPLHSPIPRASSQYLHNLNWHDLDRSSQPGTPGFPDNLISPAFTPPLTPSTPSATHHDDPLHRHIHAEPKSVPVDTSKDELSSRKHPRLLEKLPTVECVVRARIPTTSGAEMFLHLYQNDSDNKEHLAIVFGNTIRSRSLDAEKPGETEMDRMIRGAYTGRLRPGRVSSRIDEGVPKSRHLVGGRKRSESALKNVTTISENAATEASDHKLSSSIPEISEQPTPPVSENGTTSTSTDATAPAKPASPSSEIQSSPFPHVHHFHKPPLVRIHSECYTGETAWSARCDCGEQLDEAARLMSLPSSAHQGGVIVYLRQEGRGIGLASKLMAYNLQDLGNDTVEANLLLRHPADARSYGLATAILADLGLGTDSDAQKEESERGIRLLTNNPDKVRAVEGPGREVRVVERVAMVPLAWSSKGNRGVKGAEIEKYLETKIGRMGHMLER